MDEITLAHVFAKKPPYSSEELSAVIAKYRAHRENFMATGKAVPKVKKEKVSVDLANLNLDDL